MELGPNDLFLRGDGLGAVVRKNRVLESAQGKQNIRAVRRMLRQRKQTQRGKSTVGGPLPKSLPQGVPVVLPPAVQSAPDSMEAPTGTSVVPAGGPTVGPAVEPELTGGSEPAAAGVSPLVAVMLLGGLWFLFRR